MSELFFLLFAVWCAFLNRGAGSQFWGKIPSTQISRILFAVGVAVPWGILTNSWLFPLLALALWFWRWKGWDFASINGIGKPELWQNKLARKLWRIEPKTLMEKKLMGTLGMCIRMTMIIPAVVISGNYLHVVMFPLLGISYFLMGLLGEKGAVGRAEYANGALIAAMLWGW